MKGSAVFMKKVKVFICVNGSEEEVEFLTDCDSPAEIKDMACDRVLDLIFEFVFWDYEVEEV